MSAVVDVSDVLKAHQRRKGDDLPTASVSRPLEPDLIDCGNLLIVDSNRIEAGDKGNLETVLKDVARDNAQLLFNALWQLPTLKVEDVTVAQLPPPGFRLPREKPLPKPKPLTKWEKYAKEKGIVKKRKSKVEWDDVVKEWVPRYGYKKAKVEEEKNWMMEIKDNADPMEDPFEKELKAKREKVAKNELQRLRNLARARKIKVPGVGLTPVNAADTTPTSSASLELKTAADLARKSTASLGKFQDNLPNSLERKTPQGRKRKFEPLITTGETKKSLRILEQVTSKKPKLDVNKAVGKAIFEEEQGTARAKKSAASKSQKKVGGKRQGKGRSQTKGKGFGKVAGKKGKKVKKGASRRGKKIKR